MMINKRLISICKDSKKYIAFTVLCSWIGIVCNIIIIFFIGKLINTMAAGKRLPFSEQSFWETAKDFYIMEQISLLSAIIITAAALLVKLVSQHFYGKFSYLSSANARVTLRRRIYEKLLRLGGDYQKSERTSAIVQVSIEGVEQLEVYFGKYLPQFFYALLAPITLFMSIMSLSWQAALVFMLCVPLIPFSIIVIMRIAKRVLKVYWNNYANLGNTFLENLQGLTTLKVYGQDGQKHAEMNEEAESFRKITMKVLSMQLNSINVMDLIAFGGAAAGTIVGLYQFSAGHLEAGDLIIIILLSSEFFIPLRLLGSYFHIAMNGIAASDRIFALLDTEEKHQEDAQPLPDHEQLTIQLNNVHFSYDGKRQVLHNISFELTPGGLTAVVGESGSGKSTTAALLSGQLEPSSGSITVNGMDLHNVKREDLYNHLSFVSAHSHIFKGTILDNLLMAKPEATMEEIKQALKTARLAEFITQLPQGLETEVSENGSSLSGGQKQRLALARVILANRQAIIFDEATSNIDVESEEAIWEAIDELAKEKTILVISHRLACVKEAKVIHVLQSGHLVESGTHEMLLRKQGVYAQMILNQQQLESIREGKTSEAAIRNVSYETADH